MDAQLITQIETLAHKTLDDHGVPGIALGIVNPEGLIWFGGFGQCDLGRPEPPTKDSLARIASVTKTVTTTAILQLRDAGLLDLDDPLTQHIPEFGSVNVRAGDLTLVTLRRLLTHYSGLTTEAPLPGWAALDFPTTSAILESLDQTEIVIDQDSEWKYSNLAFGLLGEVIRRVSGMPFEAYVKERILDLLGMTSTVFDLDEALQDRFLTGYNPSLYQDFPEPAPYAHLNGLSAAGQLHSSVSDLAKWVAFQLGEGESTHILSARSLREMHRPQYMAPDWSSGQCLGWRATRVGNHVYHNHGGGIHGFATQVWFNVPHRIGGIQLINMWPPPSGQHLVQDVLEMILGQEEKRPKEEPSSRISVPVKYADLLGTYFAEPGIWVSVVWKNGQIHLAVPKGQASSLHAPATLLPGVRDDTFRVMGGRGAGEQVVFHREAGRVTHYELGAFVFQKLAVLRGGT